MSAEFIIEYAGAPVRFVAGQAELTDEFLASKYISEPDAWYAAAHHNLNPDRCRVINRYERNQRQPDAGPNGENLARGGHTT